LKNTQMSEEGSVNLNTGNGNYSLWRKENTKRASDICGRNVDVQYTCKQNLRRRDNGGRHFGTK
jgi:hypothetical protein